MKKRLVPLMAGFAAIVLLSGCIGLQIGGGEKQNVQSPTLGQQLSDLKKAKDSGAITEAEYETQKSKLLGKP